MKVLFPKRDNEQLHDARQYLRREIRNVIRRYGDNITATALKDVYQEFKITQAEAGDTNEYSGTGFFKKENDLYCRADAKREVF